MSILLSKLLLLLFLTGVTAEVTKDPLLNTELFYRNKLHKDLFRNYTISVRPSQNDSRPIHLRMAFYLKRLNYLSTYRNIQDVYLWIYKSWMDPRLTWNKSEYGGVEKIQIRATKVWRPDIICYNSMAGYINSNKLLTIFYNGTIKFFPVARFLTHCELDLSRFPYDTQNCTLIFGSGNYNGKEMNITEVQADLPPNKIRHQNKGWDLVGVATQRKTKKYACCPGEIFITIDLTLTWRRRWGMARNLLVLPASFIALLIPFIFLLPPNSKQKITLGISIVIAMVILELLMTYYIPTIGNKPPLISVYYMMTLGMTCLSLVISALVISLCNRGPRMNRVPALVRMVLDRVKPLVLLGDAGFPWLDEVTTIRGIDNPASEVSQASSQVDRDTDAIVKQMTTMTARSTSNDIKTDIQNEWRLLGMVVDRVLFVVYVTIYIIAAIVLFS